MQNLDVVGIGAGPSNLALGAALRECEAARNVQCVLLERQASVQWHRGMMFPDARLQITIHKDLALPRDPQSGFTFLKYLHEQGRLFEFLGLGEHLPTRIEYNDYLRWAAEKLSSMVRYNRSVTALEVVEGGAGFKVITRCADGTEEAYRARNVVLAPGGEPCVPAGIRLSERVFHSSRYVEAIDASFGDRDKPLRFVVVGAGQSAAEIFDDLLSRYPNAQITAVFRGLSYRALEEHASINQAFAPELKTKLERMSAGARARLRALWDTGNYRVVNEWLIQRIYQRLYDEKVSGKMRGRTAPLHELVGIDERQGVAVAHLRGVLDATPLSLEADAVILGTGYAYNASHGLIDGLGEAVVRDATGSISVDGSYRVALQSRVDGQLFLSGRTEEFHGPGEPLLSTSALRAQRIVETILRRGALSSG